MDIKNIHVRFYHASSLQFNEPKVVHEKNLPYLTVAQSVQGHYGLSLERGEESYTEPMGVFVAPAHKHQIITHLADETGIAEMQWIFMSVVINDKFELDDLYEFPMVLPKRYDLPIYKILSALQNNRDICDCYILIFELIRILLEIGEEKKVGDDVMQSVVHYIRENYREKLWISALAKIANTSEPSLYRHFKKELKCTPNAYINNFRLSQSMLLLETTELSIAEIAVAVGIGDPFYYSKMFKRVYGIPPVEYKRQNKV